MSIPKAAIPADVRWLVWERDDFRCHYCGARSFLSVDHIIAESNGGGLDSSNLVTACKSCNSRKHCSEYRSFRSRVWREGARIRSLWRENEYERRKIELLAQIDALQAEVDALEWECKGRQSLTPTKLIQPVGRKPAAPAIDPERIGIREAARYVGIHYQSLYGEVRSGNLLTKKFGVKYLVKRADLEAWFDALPDGFTGEQRKAS